MLALRMTAWKTEPQLVEAPDPEPGPGQVVVKVGGAGACHSDIHIIRSFDASLGTSWTLPFTLGHENAGWVHELGPGVTGLEKGQPVAVYGAWGCGSCDRCRVGIENYCENPAAAPLSPGLGGDGGMAEYMLVPSARHLVPLPAGLDPARAAPLLDAGLTPYHAVQRSAPKLRPGATAVVIGVGGLGHLALQILKATTAARIIAVDVRPQALELATGLGADLAVVSGPDAAARIREGAGGRGADVVLDFVGSDDTVALAMAVARPLGDVTLVGIAGGSYPVGFFTVPYELSVQSIYWGTRGELPEVLDLAARGLLEPRISTFALSDAPEAYRRLEEGTLTGRAVVVPHQGP